MDSPLDIHSFSPLDVELLQARLVTVATAQEKTIYNSFTSIPARAWTFTSPCGASTPNTLAPSSPQTTSGANTPVARPSTPIFIASLDNSDCDSDVALDFMAAVLLAKQQAPFCYSGQFSASTSRSTSGASTPDPITPSEQGSITPSTPTSRASTPDLIASSEQRSTSPCTPTSRASTPDLMASSEQKHTSPCAPTSRGSTPDMITSSEQGYTSTSTAASSLYTPESVTSSNHITYKGTQGHDQRLQISKLERQLANRRVQWRQSILNASPRRLKKLMRTIQSENKYKFAAKARDAEVAKQLRIIKRTQRKIQARAFRLAQEADPAGERVSLPLNSPGFRGFGGKSDWETAELVEEPGWDSEEGEMILC